MQTSDMHSNLEEYADPVLYDIENPGTHDIPLLAKWAKATGGPVIDLACGTGRATLELAAAGFGVYGLDIHPGMIAEARRKAAERGLPITFDVQDCSDFTLPVKAGLIAMTGHAFQAFLTNDDQDRLLRSVHRHLADGGVFIFDTRFPARDELLQPETEQFWRTLIDQHGRAMHESTIAIYDEFSQVQHYITIRRFENPDGTTEVSESSIWLRYTFPLELRRLLEGHGFEIVALYRDWDESPLEGDAYDIIPVARRIADAKETTTA
jgi:SAM-dependent methyltransferase